jgi:hypothetical protein
MFEEAALSGSNVLFNFFWRGGLEFLEPLFFGFGDVNVDVAGNWSDWILTVESRLVEFTPLRK